MCCAIDDKGHWVMDFNNPVVCGHCGKALGPDSDIAAPPRMPSREELEKLIADTLKT